MKWRFNANLGSIVKTTSIVANSTVLAINTYTFGRNINDRIRERKRESIQTNLEILSTIAQAASNLASTAANSIEKGKPT